MKPATKPEDLVPLMTQITKAQHGWIEATMRRLQIRSRSAVVRHALQARMDAETSQEQAS